jgi:acyl dehydratase
MTDVTEEFARATDYRLTDEDIERARLLVGVDTGSPYREHWTTATEDAIHNFAHGIGDDNPLFCDPDYGATTRWGGQIAPNIMAGVINTPLLGDPMPPEIKQRTRSLFKGIHVFVSGGTWDWYRPIHPGDRLFSFFGEETLEVKPESEFGGRSVIQVRRDVKFNQRGDVVGIYRVLRILSERKTARERGKYAGIEPASYTDEDIAAIDAAYLAERRRGAEARFWEDVTVGEEMPPMVKGPLTVTELICFHAGGYGFVPYAPTASRLAAQNRARIPAFYVKNEQGVPDVAQRLHWDPAWAQAIGNPMAYDYGVLRECWFHHYATDWAGDDAFVERQHDSIRKFNYMGDTQFLSGRVTGKRQVDGRRLVDLEMKMTNQRGVETTFGEVTVSLPSREAGPAALPQVPAAVARQTVRLYQRHLELARERRLSGSAGTR